MFLNKQTFRNFQETFRTLAAGWQIPAAAGCRKCWSYCVFEHCTHVVDIRSGEVVWGEEPSKEEYEAQAEIARQKWEEEREYLDMLDREYRNDREEEEEWEVYETKAEEAGD